MEAMAKAMALLQAAAVNVGEHLDAAGRRAAWDHAYQMLGPILDARGKADFARASAALEGNDSAGCLAAATEAMKAVRGLVRRGVDTLEALHAGEPAEIGARTCAAYLGVFLAEAAFASACMGIAPGEHEKLLSALRTEQSGKTED
jgi:hypothetical protein